MSSSNPSNPTDPPQGQGSPLTGKPARLGEILLSAKIIDRLQLNTALKYQREWDRKLGEALVELGFISEAVLVKVLSKFLQVPAVELSQVRINPAVLQKIPRRLAEKYGLMPLDIEGKGHAATMMVAMIDPTNLVAIDEVSFSAGCKVKPVVATHSEIEQAIRRHYGDDRVVDVFFDLPISDDFSVQSQKLVSSHQPNRSTAEIYQVTQTPSSPIDEMVILRRGEETHLEMQEADPPSDKSRSSFILPKSPLRRERIPESDSNQSASSVTRTITFEDNSNVDNKTLLEALVRILVRKGLFDSQELQEEVIKGLKKED